MADPSCFFIGLVCVDPLVVVGYDPRRDPESRSHLRAAKQNGRCLCASRFVAQAKPLREAVPHCIGTSPQSLLFGEVRLLTASSGVVGTPPDWVVLPWGSSLTTGLALFLLGDPCELTWFVVVRSCWQVMVV
jgi:hypothetical protein